MDDCKRTLQGEVTLVLVGIESDRGDSALDPFNLEDLVLQGLSKAWIFSTSTAATTSYASNLLRVDYFQQFHEGVCDF